VPTQAGLAHTVQADESSAYLPKPRGNGLVVAFFRRSLGITVDEVEAGHVLEIWRGGQIGRPGGALGWGFHEEPQQRHEQSLDSAAVLGPEGRAHDAGMKPIGGDAGGLQPPGQFVREQEVCELGLVVGRCTGVGPFALQTSKSIRPNEWAFDATVTTRAGALCVSRSSNRLVSKNGAR
jgi:hypothetical protein